MWSTEGVTPSPPPNGIPDGFMHCDVTHLTDFGGIQIPTSGEELLASLTPTFNTFTMDEAFALLAEFDFAAYPLLAGVIFGMIGLDVITIFLLGLWRGHRKKQRRKLDGELFEEEQVLEEVTQIRRAQLEEKGTSWAKMRLEVMEKGPVHVVDMVNAAVNRRLSSVSDAAALTAQKAGRSSCVMVKTATMASTANALKFAEKSTRLIAESAPARLKRSKTQNLNTVRRIANVNAALGEASGGASSKQGWLQRSATRVFKSRRESAMSTAEEIAAAVARNSEQLTNSVENIPTREEMFKMMEDAEEAERERREARAALAARGTKHLVVNSVAEDGAATVQERLVRRKPVASVNSDGNAVQRARTLENMVSSCVLASRASSSFSRSAAGSISRAPPARIAPHAPIIAQALGSSTTVDGDPVASGALTLLDRTQTQCDSSAPARRMLSGANSYSGNTEAMILAARLRIRAQQQHSSAAGSTIQERIAFGGMQRGVSSRRAQLSTMQLRTTGARIMPNPSNAQASTASFAGIVPSSLPPSPPAPVISMLHPPRTAPPQSPPLSPPASRICRPQLQTSVPHASLASTALDRARKPTSLPPSVLASQRRLAEMKAQGDQAKPKLKSLTVVNAALVESRSRAAERAISYQEAEGRRVVMSAPPARSTSGPPRRQMPQRPGPPPPPPGGPRATELATARVLPLGSQDAAPDEDSKDHEADDDAEEEYDAAIGKAAGLEDMSDDGEGEGEEEEEKLSFRERSRRFATSVKEMPGRKIKQLKDMPSNVRSTLISMKDDALAWRPPSKDRAKENFMNFLSNFFNGFRSDHTLISFIAPAEDDEALNEMQVVHLFWFVLMLDLYVNCVQYGGISDPSAYAPIDPINDIINTIVGAVIVVCGCMVGRSLFRWGNKRKIAEGPGLLTKIGRRLYRPIKPIAKLIEARRTKRRERRAQKNKPQGSEMPQTASNTALAETTLNSPPASPPEDVGSDDALDLPEIPDAPPPQPPPPQDKSCALVLRNKDEASAAPRPTPPAHAEEAGQNASASQGAAHNELVERRQRWAALRSGTNILWKLKQENNDAGTTRRLRVPRLKVHSVVIRAAAQSNQKGSVGNLGRRLVVFAKPNEVVAAKFKQERMRSTRVYYFRQGVAWAGNWAAYAVVTFNVIVYSAMFGPEATADLMMSWLMGLTFAMGIIEPFNIFMVAFIPAFFSEDSCCFRCYNKVFGYWNEIYG